MDVKEINNESEIDLIEIIRKLWSKRKFILKVTVICACLGILVALFSAKEYSAGCTTVSYTHLTLPTTPYV